VHRKFRSARPTAVSGKLLLVLTALVWSHSWARAVDVPAPGDNLAAGFVQPPPEARPWVYWFWLNGNITRAGVTADLEAMQRAGIGGVLIMEVDQGIPPGKLRFASEAWREMFRFVEKESARLGLVIDMNNDAGWCGSGGPWVPPRLAMKKIVWTETSVEGPGRIERTLPAPAAVADWYRDIAVLAVPESVPADTPGARLPDIGAKAFFKRGPIRPLPHDFRPPPTAVIPPERIVDLTRRMQPSGRLTWEIPAGKWTILRFGYTPTGRTNHPAPVSGRGLECDKLDPEAMDLHFRNLIGRLAPPAGDAARSALKAVHIDSWEVGTQNWTARFPEEFRKRRGYDILPWLPVITGRIVGAPDQSERFLWDFRQTIAELLYSNYAGRLAELAHAHGMQLTIEAYGDGPFSELPYAGRADSPMGEFWVGGGAMRTLKAMASAGHVYGRRIIGAEAFTAAPGHGRWTNHPFSLKALGDQAFCMGINRFVIHRYAMQPWPERPDRKPGMTMGPWGVHYERTNTWWGVSGPWHTYLARCQFLLRRGLFVADVCLLQPEGAPAGASSLSLSGYDYDACPAEVILTRMSVQNGRFVLPDGMGYRLLVLPRTAAMTPGLLGRLRDLVAAGGAVLGEPPTHAPGLTDYPRCDGQVRSLAAELWGNCDGRSVTERRYGAGRVFRGIRPEEALVRLGVPPDFRGPPGVRAIHRRDGDADIYFVANARSAAGTAVCTFRVRGRLPELWRPDTGRMSPAPMFRETKDGTRVLLAFDPCGSVFVVFRKPIASDADPAVAVYQDQRPVLSLLPEGGAIRVVKAMYGVLGDSERTRDVRAGIQQWVDAGRTRFQVAELAQDEDPARGVVKTAVIEYTIDGRHFTVTGRDPDVVVLAPRKYDIRIIEATYGVPGDSRRTRDVREKVQRLVEAGRTNFKVAELARGDDPAYGIVKTVRIRYRVDGREYTVQGTDPEYVFLGPHWTRTLMLQVDDAGRMVLDTTEAGQFEVRFASRRPRRFTVGPLPPAVELTGPWNLRFFPAGSGEPRNVVLDELISWSEHPDEGIRYFSGTAVYTLVFDGPDRSAAAAYRWRLDLGDVRVIARVRLNGQDLGVLWKPPFEVDVTGVLRPGPNRLAVDVTNLWPNRLIGDQHLPEDCKRTPRGNLVEWPRWLLEGRSSPTGRHTFTTWRLWSADDPPLPSGLLGPVRLVAVKRVVLQASRK